jgi:hypothetical protein
MSFKRWGVWDLSWLFTPGNTLPRQCSPLWLNMCRNWNKVKKACVKEIQPVSVDAARGASVWIPSNLMKDRKLAGCSTVAQQELKEAGINLLEDITDAEGRIISWEQQSRSLPSSTKRAYMKLCANFQLQGIPREEKELYKQVTTFPVQDGNTVWEIVTKGYSWRRRWPTEGRDMQVRATFRMENRFLMQAEEKPLPNQMLYTTVTGQGKLHSKGKTLKYIAGLAHFEIGIVQRNQWFDRKEILQNSTAKIRRTLSDSSTATHVGLRK